MSSATDGRPAERRVGCRAGQIASASRAGGYTDLLSRDEEVALALRASRGDRAAADRLVTCHLPFVRAVARRYSRYGTPVNDLVQEGVIGLIQAVRKFDPESGVRLSTYAGWWVRVRIQEHVVRSEEHTSELQSLMRISYAVFC